MLFTDSNLITASDMTSIDSEVAKISADNNSGITIDISAAEAWKLCRAKLEASLQLFTTLYGVSGSEAHLAAVFNTGFQQPGTRARIRLNQIVAHDAFYSGSRSQIQGWVLYEALTHFYRNIANRYMPKTAGFQIEDRYANKVKRYQELADFYWRTICNSGIPFVQTPFEAPGAMHAFNAGVWGPSNLSAVTAGAMANDLAVNVAVTWHDSTYYVGPTNKMNAESGPSQVLSFTIPALNVLNVSISSLHPPNGNSPDPVGVSQGPIPIHTATHWNIYIGPSGSGVGIGNPMYLQHGAIPIGTTSYQFASAPLFDASLPVLQCGQIPDPGSNILFARTIKRG